MSVTVNDLIARWRPLSSEEIEKAKTFIQDAENAIHVYAYDRGYNLDEMLASPPERMDLYTAIICDIVKREMTTYKDDGPAMSQTSMSVNGYNVQGTYLVAGGGLFVKNSELKQLGLRGQKARKVELYEY